MIFKTFRWSFAITIVGLVGAFLLGYFQGEGGLQHAIQFFVLVAILTILEISLSFDNAVVNAKVLERMSPFWQKMFLTVGIAIAVFGMRLVFPLLIVAITAGLNPVEAVRLALEGGDIHEQGTYAYHLHEAHPAIAAFGGMFLLMLFLNFLFEEKEITWLSWLERPLARLGKLDMLAVSVALIILVIAAEFLTSTRPDHTPATVMVSGVLGAVTYILVNGLGELFEGAGEDEDEEGTESAPATSNGPSKLAKATGKAGFFLFLYLEVLDASFSFDGVIGAFAITSDIFVIAIGLGVGAMYIRSLTVYLVRKGTLQDYVFLEHGAMWAIGSLAILLLVTIRYEVPEVITGLIGVGFIGAAFITSIIRNRREAANGDAAETEEAAKKTANV